MSNSSTPDIYWQQYHCVLEKQMVGVYSEAGKLDLVLMHRPGRELERLTPQNKVAFLFDDIPNVDETRKSHDIFVNTIRKKGVTVVYVLDILCETLEQSAAARKMLIDGIVHRRGLQQEASSALAEILTHLTPTQLAHVAIEGLTYTTEELGDSEAASTLLRTRSLSEEFLVPPLPNLLFTRDAFSIMERSVFIWRMSRSARENEPLIMQVIFSFHISHAKFSLAGVHVFDWRKYADPAATIEGGDVCYLGQGRLLIGNSERTNRAGIEAIARTGLFRQVIAVELPISRDYIHLDTILSSVGLHSFALHQYLANRLPVYTVQTPAKRGAKPEWVAHGRDVRQALRHLLSDPTLYFYDAADEETSIIEQHQLRDNMLCINDQNAITYAGGDPVNGIVNQMLQNRQRPCRVETFPQRGLIEGYGGAHCMTNALCRLLK